MPRSILAVMLAVAAYSPNLPQAHAAGPYDDLLKHTPGSTNVIALIDARGAYSSELARQEKWKEKGQPDHRGLGFVPPQAERVVVVADVNLSAMSRYYQIGFVKMPQVPSIRNLATIEGGSSDMIADEPVVWSPRNVYFTLLSPTELAAVYPADRQGTARWLRAVKAKKTGELSAYLQKAAETAAQNTVTIAMDLRDTVDRNVLKLALPASPTVAKNKKLDIPTLAAFLAGVRGLTFSAKIEAGITANITIDFGSTITRYRTVLPELFRELLEGNGIAIGGIDAWEAKFTETSMTLSGPLATADLKRIVSLFSFPGPGSEAEPMAKAGEPSATATRRYLSAVDSILADLSKLKDSPNYVKTATWHDNAAAQLEQLSRQGVDPVAVDAALESSKRLRAISESLRGVPIDLSALEKSSYYSARPSLGVMPGGPWGWQPFIFGPTQVRTNIPEIRATMMKVIADDQKRRLETWSRINQIMVDARMKLTEKYRIKF